MSGLKRVERLFPLVVAGGSVCNLCRTSGDVSSGAFTDVNPANRVELEGTVHGVPWTSFGRGQQGRVNFWLGVSRDMAGEGFDLLQCAIEPHSGDELKRLDGQIRDGRSIRLVAHAHSLVDLDAPAAAQQPRVIFVAHQCAFDHEALGSAHRIGSPRRHHCHGKAAAAGDLDQAAIEDPLQPELLPMEGSK